MFQRLLSQQTCNKGVMGNKKAPTGVWGPFVERDVLFDNQSMALAQEKLQHVGDDSRQDLAFSRLHMSKAPILCRLALRALGV
jgi:hypothetical protein